MQKIICLLISTILFSLTASAGEEGNTSSSYEGIQRFFNFDSRATVKKETVKWKRTSLFGKENSLPTTSWFKRNHVADNLEVGLTIGTTGFGLEVATPVTRWVKVRTGVDWIPSFHVPMNFDINTFSDGLPSDNFQHVQEMVYELTGIEVDDRIKMIGKPTMLNFKFLVDVFPFEQNRHWHFTAGFYIGSSTIATAVNDRSEKQSLVGLNIYNRAYEYFNNLTDIFDVPIGGGNYMDPEQVLRIQRKFREYGRMGIKVGEFKDTGEPYIMEPAPDGSVSAKAYANMFKPYLGFGYGGFLDKEQKWTVGVEAGILIWGGVPDVINHDRILDSTGERYMRVNMTKDLKNVKGKVGDYLNVFKALPVYPAINFRISYTIF